MADAFTISKSGVFMKHFILPVLISVVTLQTSVRAQETDTYYDVAPAATMDDAEIGKDVLDILTRMTEFISGAQAYTLVAEMGHEVLQRDGQTLEFGSSITATLQRPSQANVRFDNRDGDKSSIVLNGETISVFSIRENLHVYDVTHQPGDIDTSFVFLAEQLGTPDQLHHFFSIDLTDSMKSTAKSGYYVGEATIAGILCDNLALRNEDEDVQLWIAKGDRPVPRRIVVKYKNLEGQPQFWVQFEEWNFSPTLSETVFSYSPPAHADRVDFFQNSLVDESK
jgi:hypothetical protein